MLQGVYLRNYDDVEEERDEKELHLTSKNLDYEIFCDSSEVSLQENSFVVTKANATVTLNFNGWRIVS